MDDNVTRQELISQIKWYCEELEMGYPKGFPDDMSDEQMKDWVETWDEFDPFPDA